MKIMERLLFTLLALSLAAAALAGGLPRRPWLDPNTGDLFFPLGWFEWESAAIGGPKGPESLARAIESLDAMAAEGANTVLLVNEWARAAEDAQLESDLALWKDYLDHAHAKGVRVIAHIGSGWLYALGDEKNPALAACFERWVKTMAPHPALLGYQLFDEPECRFGGKTDEDAGNRQALIRAMIAAHDAIRRWDPNERHTVQAVFNLVPHEGHSPQDWLAFLPALDAFQVDRYGINRQFPFFPHGKGTVGDWGALRLAWQISHAVAAIEATSHRNPATVLQGMGKNYYEGGYHWRDPLYDETRYMAYSSLTQGAWGLFHWIRNVSPPAIRANVARLHAELRTLIPAFKQSWQNPPFTVEHNHNEITRDWLTDKVPDLTTLALEDDENYYLVAVDNTGVFEDVSFRMRLPAVKDEGARRVTVLNEDWGRDMVFDPVDGKWIIPAHTMCFGDVNIFVIQKALP